jgi:hypothetical protein
MVQATVTSFRTEPSDGAEPRENFKNHGIFEDICLGSRGASVVCGWNELGRHSGFQPKRKSISGPRSNDSATNFTPSAHEFRRPAPDSTSCVPNFLLEKCQRAL